MDLNAHRVAKTYFWEEPLFVTEARVPCTGELRLSGNHTVTEYEMSGKPYSQKSGLKNHTNEQIFQVMTRFDECMTR